MVFEKVGNTIKPAILLELVCCLTLVQSCTCFELLLQPRKVADLGPLWLSPSDIPVYEPTHQCRPIPYMTVPESVDFLFILDGFEVGNRCTIREYPFL